MTAVVIGTLALAVLWDRLPLRVGLGAVGVLAVVVHPLVGGAVVLAALASVLRRPASPPEGGALLLADQVALALRAGLTLEGALREARADLPDGLAGEVGGLLRNALANGLGPALASATGKGERLYRITDRAVRTGAPVGAAVEALAEELRHEDHARRSAEARRLPVRMLMPLALLILPGFVLAMVGPALIGSLARLDIGW